MKTLLVALCVALLALSARGQSSPTLMSSTYRQACTTPCELQSSWYWSDYLWCDTADGWDFCSTDPTLTSDGASCTNGCARHEDTTYTWCSTADSWGYCSKYRQST